MKLDIDRVHVEALAARFPRLAFLLDQLRFGPRAEVAANRLTAEEMDYLLEQYQAGGPALLSRAAQLATLRRALCDGGKRYRADDLEALIPGLLAWLLDGGERGWLFTAAATGRPLPYVITRIDFTPASNDESARLFIELKANTKGSVAANVLRISGPEADGLTIGEIFAAKGYLKETPELLAAYDAAEARYFDWRGRSGAQFSAQGVGIYAADPSSNQREMDWSRKDMVVLSSQGGFARLVNDESILADRALTLDAPGDVMAVYLRKAGKSNAYEEEDAVEKLRAKLPAGFFTRMPVHGYILMFHLDLHHYVWVHVDDMRPYEYQPALKQKLVLPPEQIDLIDILTAEMDLLMDDIIVGKSGGATVLCAGPPGVGKTLTAEVYSEIIRRPLYRVHSGQLGLNVMAMETALKEVLTRAQRWGAVMLIDEADVYIRRRDDDMTMNAVVGVFLRVLEYFNGLLFLTTNRIDDIDEAIVSRCIALIRYQPPDAAARARIWGVMAEQFGLKLSAEMIEDLARVFPAATGRDIKGLAKLTAKFCNQKKLPPDMAAFRRCAVFRGLEAAG